MRIAVVGASGLVGSNVVREADARGYEVTGTYRSREPGFDVPLHRLDLRDEDAIRVFVDEIDPDVVINAAALTDVDGCEGSPEAARAINGEAPGVLASACAEWDAAFVHLSTDYVFDGAAESPYHETAEPNPVQVYGRTKLAGERAVADATDGALVARLSFVYGVHGASGELSGFPAWVRETLADGGTVPLFADQFVTPTRAGQAAAVLLDLLAEGVAGTVNVACGSCVTPYEFGATLVDLLDVSRDRLERSSMADVERPAERPRYTCLDCGKLEELLGRPQPSLVEDLKAIEGAL